MIIITFVKYFIHIGEEIISSNFNTRKINQFYNLNI